MSPVTLAELDPVTRAKALQQIGETESGTTALATVVNETFTTLGDPAQMTTDALVTVVIGGVQKIRGLLPYIAALKARFDEGQRDSANRLVNPIHGCCSWRDFCVTHLDRAPQTINRAFAAPQPQVKPAPEPTKQPIIIDAEFMDAPDPQPAGAPLTFKDVDDWHMGLMDDESIPDVLANICFRQYRHRNKLLPEYATQMAVSFNYVTPAIAKKLVEYFLQLKKAEPQPPSDPQPEPAPDINTDPPSSIVFCKAKNKKGDSCIQCSGLKDGLCPLHHPERIAERAAIRAKLKFYSEFGGSYNELLDEIRYPDGIDGREPTPEDFQKLFHKVCAQYKISPEAGLEIFEECSGLPDAELAILREHMSIQQPLDEPEPLPEAPQPTKQQERAELALAKAELATANKALKAATKAAAKADREGKRKVQQCVKPILLQLELKGLIQEWKEQDQTPSPSYKRNAFLSACAKAGTSVRTGRRTLVDSEHITADVREMFLVAAKLTFSEARRAS